MNVDNANPGYIIKSAQCGRDKDGVFHCRCGKCEEIQPKNKTIMEAIAAITDAVAAITEIISET